MTDNETPNEGDDAGANGPRPPAIPPAPPIFPEQDPSVGPVVNLRIPLVDGLPPQQRRWTVALRIILCIPHFIVLFFVWIGAFFTAIATWFVALFTGKVPAGMGSFLAFAIRWSVRVNAYAYLLTDVYPPFDGNEHPEYPVDVEFPELSSLNRLSVLFRLVLMIPAYFISSLLAGGLAVFLVPFWIAALILGRLPDPVYRVMASVARFSARVSSFLFMLTSEYPWGWKGDALGDVAPSVPSTSDGSTNYWAPVAGRSSTPAPVETTRFDFHLTGWAQSWVWIFLAVGLVSNARTKSY